MTNISITISLDEADRQRFDRLISALEGRTIAPAAAPATAPSVAPPAVGEHPVDAVTPCAEPAPAAAPVAEVTAEALMAKVRKLSAAGSPLRPKVKAAVNKYAPTVSAIRPEDRAACMADLEQLESEAQQ